MPALHTREIILAPGALAALPEVLVRHFRGRPALLVADRNTFAAAGRAVMEALGPARTHEPFLFTEPHCSPGTRQSSGCRRRSGRGRACRWRSARARSTI